MHLPLGMGAPGCECAGDAFSDAAKGRPYHPGDRFFESDPNLHNQSILVNQDQYETNETPHPFVQGAKTVWYSYKLTADKYSSKMSEWSKPLTLQNDNKYPVLLTDDSRYYLPTTRTIFVKIETQDGKKGPNQGWYDDDQHRFQAFVEVGIKGPWSWKSQKPDEVGGKP